MKTTQLALNILDWSPRVRWPAILALAFVGTAVMLFVPDVWAQSTVGEFTAPIRDGAAQLKSDSVSIFWDLLTVGAILALLAAVILDDPAWKNKLIKIGIAALIAGVVVPRLSSCAGS